MPSGIYKHKSLTEITKERLSKALKNKPKPDDFGEKISKALTGRKLSKEHKESLRGSRPNFEPWNKGKEIGKQSKESRLKKRLAQIDYVEKTKLNGLQLFPCTGKYETQILNNLESNFGYKILRQYKIAGYFLDGYCPVLNLAIEIDEPKHTNKREKDIERQKEIEEELHCTFLRIALEVY